MDPHALTPLQLVHALECAGAAMAGIAFWFAVRHLEQQHRGGFLQWHHYYIGAALLVLVPTFGGWWVAVSVALWTLGFVLAVDDAVQHSVQVDDPAYRSPVHRAYTAIYAFLARHQLTQWLARILAALGGG